MTEHEISAVVDAALAVWRADVETVPYGPALDSAALLRTWRDSEILRQLTVAETITHPQQDLAAR